MKNNSLVLNILKKNPKGLTAYQILNRAQKFKFVQPMTIYRALKSLTNALILNEYYKRQRLILIRNKYKLLCKEFIILPEFLIIHILSFEFPDSHNCISIKV